MSNTFKNSFRTTNNEYVKSDYNKDDASLIHNDSTQVLTKEHKERDFSDLKAFLSGGFGGICLVLAGHPMDLIKVKMQLAKKGEFSSVWSCWKTIASQGGVRAFYRGVLPPLLGVVPIMATSVWGYQFAQKICCDFWSKDNNSSLEPWQKAVAGGMSALPTTVWVAPGERLKCLLQSAPPSVVKRGTLDIAKGIYISSGFKGLYRGTLATLLRDVPSQMVYYSSYDYAKMLFASSESNKSTPLYGIMLSGGIAGVLSWVVAIPPDVVKSRIQTSPHKLGLKAAYQQLVQSEGYRGLSRGMAPALIRAFPANAAFFSGNSTFFTLIRFLKICLDTFLTFFRR